jgi:hypothetical protein
MPTAIGGDDDLRVVGCDDVASLIILPAPRQRISEEFIVLGVANGADFAGYRIDLRPDWAEAYTPIVSEQDSVRFGELVSIDPAEYGRGVFWLRLTVEREAQLDDVLCEIPVYFD